MKKFIITFLGIFLLSASMNAMAATSLISLWQAKRAASLEASKTSVTLAALLDSRTEYRKEHRLGLDDYSSEKREEFIQRGWYLDRQIKAAEAVNIAAHAKQNAITAQIVAHHAATAAAAEAEEIAAAAAAAAAAEAEEIAAEAKEIKDSKTYCVGLPGHKVINNKWTKRDNHVGARWKYKLTNGSVHTVRGNWDGEDVPDRYLHNINHIYYSRGDRPICINFARLQRDVAPSTAVSLWLDVKYGTDCPARVPNQQTGYKYHVTNGYGNLIDPWHCN